MKYIIFSLFLIATSVASAGYQEGTITQVIVRQSDGLHYFHMSGKAVDRASCAANQSYWMIKDENSVSGKSQLSMILTAYASGKTVRVTGTGNCLRWNDGESVNTIRLK